MSAEAVFAINRVFEKESFEGFEGESHVATEENKEANTREILKEVRCIWGDENTVKRKLAEKNSDVKESYIYNKNGFFGKKAVEIENGRDGKGDHKKAGELGGEIVGILAIDKTIVKAPEEGGRESDFDMFPGGFVDSGKEANGAILAGPVVEKVGKSA